MPAVILGQYNYSRTFECTFCMVQWRGREDICWYCNTNEFIRIVKDVEIQQQTLYPGELVSELLKLLEQLKEDCG